MRFLFTVRLPARNGGQFHNIVAEHPAESFEALAAAINKDEVIVVDELWIDNETGEVKVAGPAIISRRVIGKARLYREGRRRE